MKITFEQHIKNSLFCIRFKSQNTVSQHYDITFTTDLIKPKFNFLRIKY